MLSKERAIKNTKSATIIKIEEDCKDLKVPFIPTKLWIDGIEFPEFNIVEIPVGNPNNPKMTDTKIRMWECEKVGEEYYLYREIFSNDGVWQKGSVISLEG